MSKGQNRVEKILERREPTYFFSSFSCSDRWLELCPIAPRAPRAPRLPSPPLATFVGKKPLNISVGTRTATRITETTSRIFFLTIKPIKRVAR